MGTDWHPNLLTYFTGDSRVITLNYSQTYWYNLLTIYLGDAFGQLKIKQSFLIPWLKPSTLSVIVALSHIHFRSNQESLLIETKNSAIVKDSVVGYRHSNIAKDIFGELFVTENVA